MNLTASAVAARGLPLAHFWNLCVGAGRANEGLRADWQRQLRQAVAACGFRYLRFHGLFHDDMFVYREDADGQPLFNFQYVDELFDALLDCGVKPFVEFGFCPGDLATEKGTVFWWKGHGSPPKDYGKWAALVEATLRHWIARYGLEEVRSWYFEVWNEPNLHPFFRGTRSQYFELYRVTAQAVKAVDIHLRVGGPATSNFVPDARFDGETEDTTCLQTVLDAKDPDALDWRPVWVVPFLAYCHANGLPVDFVSCHPYPTDWALDEHTPGGFRESTRGIGATPRDLARLREIVHHSPFPDAEIHLTEWSSSSSPRDFTHDFLQAATFVVKANLDSIDSVDSLAYWTFTDIFEEGGAGGTIFHGGFGMINAQGIVKPTFHAYRFLHALGDELLARVPGGVVTRERATGRLAALTCHYPSEMPLSAPASFGARDTARETLALGQPLTTQIEFTNLPAGAESMVETLDQTHGNALACWEALGAPENPTREQTAELRRQAETLKREKVAADGSGRLLFACEMMPWSVVLLRQI